MVNANKEWKDSFELKREDVEEWYEKLHGSSWFARSRVYSLMKQYEEINKEEVEVAKEYERIDNIRSKFADKITDEIYVITDHYSKNGKRVPIYIPHVVGKARTYEAYPTFEMALLAALFIKYNVDTSSNNSSFAWVLSRLFPGIDQTEEQK